MQTKQEIRTYVKQQRKALSVTDSDTMSAAIMERIAACGEFGAATTVLAYWPLPGEVDTRSLIQAGGKRFVLPVVCGDDLLLKVYDPSRMREGAFGILEPDESAETVAPEEIDFAIIPGVAFSPDGMRLGRGRGFYDRLLGSLHCVKAGVAFPFQMFDELPADPWDLPMDLVVTP